MYNINKSLSSIRSILQERNFTTKVKLFFSITSYGDDYDPFEDNVTYTSLNPLTIRAYVRDISPEALVWKSYGMKEVGAKELLCDSKYTSYFLNANEIEIDGDKFEVYREAEGNRNIIQKRHFNLIRVILQKK